MQDTIYTLRPAFADKSEGAAGGSRRVGREGLSKGLSNGLSNGLSKGLSNDFQKDFHMTFKRTFKMTFKRIFKWMFERFSKICEKPLKNVWVLKQALQNKMFLGQNTARPSFLNAFFTKKWFHCSFTMVGRFAGRPRPTRADKTLRFPLWVGRGRPPGDPPERTNTQTHKQTHKQSTLRRRRLPLPNALRNEISRSGALTLIYNCWYVYVLFAM